jgi:hypothetical protein
VTGYGTLGLRPLAQTPSEGQQFSEFPALVAKTTHGVLWFLPLDCVSILDPPRLELVWAENRYKPSECSRRDGARRPHRATSGASCTAQLQQPGGGHRSAVSWAACKTEFCHVAIVPAEPSSPRSSPTALLPSWKSAGGKDSRNLVRVSRGCNPGLAPERGTLIGARHEKMALLCAQPSASEVSLLEPPKVPDPSESAAAEISSALVADVRALVNAARHRAAQAINAELVLLYWGIGNRIRRDILGRSAYWNIPTS